MSEPKSRAQAINAMCRASICDDRAAGTWREQTAACENGGCPLFAVRPFPRHVPTKETLAGLRKRLGAANRRAPPNGP